MYNKERMLTSGPEAEEAMRSLGMTGEYDKAHEGMAGFAKTFNEAVYRQEAYNLDAYVALGRFLYKLPGALLSGLHGALVAGAEQGPQGSLGEALAAVPRIGPLPLLMGRGAAIFEASGRPWNRVAWARARPGYVDQPLSPTSRFIPRRPQERC